MASYEKYECFVEDLGKAVHNLSTHTLKIVLTATTKDLATHTTLSSITQITGTGYTAGGIDIVNTYTRSGGTGTLAATDQTWTATAADWQNFRYVVTYNDDPTSPADPLICLYDYGVGGLTLGNNETFTVDYGASVFTLA